MHFHGKVSPLQHWRQLYLIAVQSRRSLEYRAPHSCCAHKERDLELQEHLLTLDGDRNQSNCSDFTTVNCGSIHAPVEGIGIDICKD